MLTSSLGRVSFLSEAALTPQMIMAPSVLAKLEIAFAQIFLVIGRRLGPFSITLHLEVQIEGFWLLTLRALLIHSSASVESFGSCPHISLR